MYRHHALARKMKALVSAGALGTPTIVRGVFAFWHDPRARTCGSTRTRWGRALGRRAAIRSVWPAYVLGAGAVEVMAWQRLGKSGVDEQAAAMLRFPGGVIAHVDCGFRSTYRVAFDIVGTEASLTVPNPLRPVELERIVLRRATRRGDRGGGAQPLLG